MDVDETGRERFAGAVDALDRIAIAQVADQCDAIVDDTDIRGIRKSSGAVDDFGIHK
jgi:hypothetical protein